MVKNNRSGLERALVELENGNYKSFNSVEELFDDLNDEDDNGNN